MWFTVDDPEFMGKIIEEKNGLSVFVSDLKQVWHKFLSEEEMIAIFKNCNPLFDVPLSKIKEIIFNLLNDHENEKAVSKIKKDEMVLKVESHKMNAKLLYQVILIKCHEEMMFNEFITPLLFSIMQFQARERKLINIIKEKDLKLDEYKLVNSSFITRPSKPFVEKPVNDEEIFNFPLNSIKWDSSEFLNCIKSKLYCLANRLTHEGLIMPKAEVDDNCNEKLNINSSKKENSSQSKSLKGILNLNIQLVKKRKRTNNLI